MWAAGGGTRGPTLAARARGVPWWVRTAASLSLAHPCTLAPFPHPNTPAPPPPRADPFEAMQGVVGYTWRAAEALADRLGHDPGSPARGGAALLHVLRTVATSAGHSYLPWAQLRDGGGPRARGA